MEFIIKSKALYTTWLYYKPDRILFDVGEGISSVLGNKIYGIEKIFFTHAHIDHIAGLWGLINTRNNAMGSREKKLDVYYPKNSYKLKEYIDFIKKTNTRLRYELNFIELPLDAEVEITKKRFIRPFKTYHSPGEVSYGYQIIEKRSHLKAKFKNFSEEEIIGLSKSNDKSYYMEDYFANVITVSGDSLPLSSLIVKDCKTLIHECTFLKEKDRKIRNHTSLDELIQLVKENKPKNLIVYHISSRYNSIVKSSEKKFREMFPDIKVTFVHPEHITKI